MMPPSVHILIYTAIALLFLTWGGNLFCRGVFHFTGLASVPSPDPIKPIRAGRVVGSLERLIMAAGLAAGSWEVIAAVVALKTVARFQELDNKLFAEYFLIGSLCSLLWASLITGSWIAYDEILGAEARDRIAAIIAPSNTDQGSENGKRN